MMTGNTFSMFRLLLSVALSVAFMASGVNAATYYVSPAGNDSNNGTSQASAWKTLAKINNTALQPGDTVLFKRGAIWRESLTVKTSGAAGKPITFDAYGTGNKPVFYGSDVLENTKFTSAGGSNYSYNLPGLTPLIGNAGVYVLQDNQFLGTTHATYNDPTLTITSPTDPRSDKKLYTACVRGNTVFNCYQSHLVFRNIVVDETAMWMEGNNQGYGFRIQGCTDVLVENCEALHCGRHNFGLINAHQVLLRNCHAAYGAPNYDGGNTLYVSYADRGAPVPKCDTAYENCTAEHEEDGKGGKWGFIVTHGDNVGSTALTNCTMHSGAAFMSSPVFIHGGTLDNDRVTSHGSGTVVEGVTFKNNAMIDLFNNSQDNIIQNCVWQNVSPAETACILMRSGAHNNTIRFCTIKAEAGACMGFYSDTAKGGDGRQSGLQFYGNIMQGTVTSAGNAGDVSYADCNFYGDSPTIFGSDWAAWQKTGKHAHSKTGNPLFVNTASGDYTLQRGSPAIDAAGGVPSTPSVDLAGNSRPKGASADMGAYEYGATPATPAKNQVKKPQAAR